jgi:hypothetical protein
VELRIFGEVSSTLYNIYLKCLEKKIKKSTQINLQLKNSYEKKEVAIVKNFKIL